MRLPGILLPLLVLVAPLHAQGPAPMPVRLMGPQASEVWAVTAPENTDTARVRRGSYWQAGAITGGLVGTVFGGGVMHTICQLSETGSGCDIGNAILGSLTLGAAGATLGALVGGLFPRYGP